MESKRTLNKRVIILILIIAIVFILGILKVISISDVLETIISIIAVVLSLVAIDVSNKNIKNSNDQFLFDRRIEIYNTFESILNVKFDLIETFNSEKEDKEYYNNRDLQEERREELKSLTNQHLSYIIHNFSTFENINFISCENLKDYEEARIFFLVYIENISKMKNNIKYFFKDSQTIDNADMTFDKYITLLKSYNTFYYSYFHKEKNNGVLFEHLKKIKENQIELNNWIKNAHNASGDMDKEIRI